MIKTYVIVWEDVVDNLLSIESQISNYSIINSNAKENPLWNNLGMVWYCNQLYFALTDFIENTDDDIFCFITGDIKSTEIKNIFSRAKDVLKDKDNFLYAPHFTYEAWSEDKCSLKPYKDGLNYSCSSEGIFYFTQREFAKIILDYLKYLSEKEDLINLKSGWGLGHVFSSICVYLNKYIIRDTKNIVFHPKGSSYEHNKASNEAEIIKYWFLEYCRLNDMNVQQIKSIMNKVDGRRVKDSFCMEFNNWYSE